MQQQYWSPRGCSWYTDREKETTGTLSGPRYEFRGAIAPYSHTIQYRVVQSTAKTISLISERSKSRIQPKIEFSMSEPSREVHSIEWKGRRSFWTAMQFNGGRGSFADKVLLFTEGSGIYPLDNRLYAIRLAPGTFPCQGILFG